MRKWVRMMKQYTYDPDKIRDYGPDQMRFELGDVMVEGGSDTAALSDEEISAVLKGYPDPNQWKQAKLALVESVCRRFAYEVDTKTDKLSLALNQRAQMWKSMYEELREEVSAGDIYIPISVNENQGHEPYFYTGMMQNFAGGGTEQT